MANIQYDILNTLVSHSGEIDITTLMDELTTKDISDNELAKERNNIAVEIIKMTAPEHNYIRTINFIANTDLSKYFDTRKWAQDREDEFDDSDADKKISITEDGRLRLATLKELFDPTPPIPQQTFYQTTHGHGSPIAGHDLTMRDIKTNEESPEMKQVAKKGLALNKWILIVAILAILVSIVLWLLTK